MITSGTQPIHGTGERGVVGRLVDWWRTGGWYVVVAIAGFGFLSPVGFVHAAIRTRARDLWAWAVLYTAAVVAVFVLSGSAPHGPTGTPTGPLAGIQVGLTILIWIAAPGQLVGVRRRVFGLRPAPAPLPEGAYRDNPAVAAVLAQRQRRAEARRLAASDPGLARELGIGRPDLRRGYDDGGLVELNTAPAAVLAAVLDLSSEQVRRITDLRGGAGPVLAGVEDLFAYTDLPYPLWDQIRERGIVLASATRSAVR
jgi:hypothetical protein